MSAPIELALNAIRARAPGFAPRTGIVLGTGLGGFCDEIEAIATLPYRDLPGFPVAGVGSHAGRLVLGHVAGAPVAILDGRAHYYEEGRADAMKIPVRTLAHLGCCQLVCTSAAGSLRLQMAPGSVMLVTDHINFTGVSPLFGEASDDRFVDLSDAYHPQLRRRLHGAAASIKLVLHDGIYIWFSGPNFETPAEIRAAIMLGADAVGMSTVPEVVLARHAGLEVAALSIITNFAAGLSSVRLSHNQSIAAAEAAADSVRRLLVAFLANSGTDAGEPA
jgi:purine nucleotide phosphorylase